MEEQLFYDSELDALRDDVNACGGPKDVGAWFWPDKTVENRRNRVNDRLNGERTERFTDDQKRLIMRRARERRGFSATLSFICDDTGFERPKPKNPKDETLVLIERAGDLARESRRVADALDRLTRSPIAIVTKQGA